MHSRRKADSIPPPAITFRFEAIAGTWRTISVKVNSGNWHTWRAEAESQIQPHSMSERIVVLWHICEHDHSTRLDAWCNAEDLEDGGAVPLPYPAVKSALLNRRQVSKETITPTRLRNEMA